MRESIRDSHPTPTPPPRQGLACEQARPAGKTSFRKLLKLVAAVVLLVVIVAGIAWLYIDSIATTGIEEGATYALGVPTTVEDVSVSLLGGTVKIFGLTVANPEGFKVALPRGSVAAHLPFVPAVAL